MKTSKPDIICITETWLNPNIDSSLYVGDFNTEYTFIRVDRAKTSGGGVGIFLKQSFSYKLILSESISHGYEILAIDLFGCSNDIRVVLLYRAPNCLTHNSEQLIKAIGDLISCDKPAIVLGDLNLSDIDWDSLASHSTLSKSFLDLCISSDLKQYVNSPTRGENILDLVCSNGDFIDDLRVSHPIGTSDHNTVMFSISLSSVQLETVHIPDYNKADYTTINNVLLQVDWDLYLSGHLCVNSMYNTFLDIVHAVASEHVPFSRFFSTTNNLLVYLENMQKHRYYLWNKFQQSNSGWSEYKLFNDKFQKALKKYYRSIEKRIIEGKNQNAFYRFIRKRLKPMNKVSTIIDTDNNCFVNDREKANALVDYFESVYSYDNGYLPSLDEVQITCPCPHPLYFDRETVYRLLNSIKKSYSQTPDGIPGIFFKNISVSIVVPVEMIFNMSMQTGIVPEVWKHSLVTPIPKTQFAKYTKDYRPIAITSHLCRVFEKGIRQTMITHVESNNLIHSNQHGFVKGKSVETQMLECLHDSTKSVDDKSAVDVMYLDFSKAFDKVSHKKLVHKLKHLGFHSMISKWIENYLSNRTFQVKVNTCFSDIRESSSGVPQGGVLSPLLFALYTYEIPSLFESVGVTCKVFADDTKLYQEISKGTSNLQEAFNVMMKWSNVWQLPLAAEKTKVLRLGGKNNPNIDYISSGSKLTSISDYVRDLGFLITPDLSFSVHCANIARKANNRIYSIFKALLTEDKTTLLRAYTIYVRPILESGITVFNSLLKKDVKLLERVQKSYTRKLFLRSGEFSYADVPSGNSRNRQLGLCSLESRRSRADIRMIHKMRLGHVKTDINQFFTFVDSNTRGGTRKLHWKTPRINLRKNFFVCRAGSLYIKLQRELDGILTKHKLQRTLEKQIV